MKWYEAVEIHFQFRGDVDFPLYKSNYRDYHLGGNPPVISLENGENYFICKDIFIGGSAHNVYDDTQVLPNTYN